jgi:hypothetical protein
MPSPLVDKGHSVFRDWFRKVWTVRGGGLYAVGFAVTFVILELQEIVGDLASLGAVFTGGGFDAFIGVVIDFIVDSFMNTFYSLIWPVYVIQWRPPWGAIALGLAYAGFASILKKPITNWLFDGEPEPEPESKK